jgi:hypothetical protein
VCEEAGGETVFVEETGDDVVESGEVLLFACGEACGHGGGDAGGLEVVGETAVGEPAVGELEDGVAVLFEQCEGFAEGGHGETGGGGGGGEVEGEPETAVGGGGEDGAEGGSFGGVAGGDDFFLRAEEADAAAAVERADGGDEAIGFEGGEEGFGDVGAGVGGEGEVVEGDVEVWALAEEGVDDGGDGDGAGGIAADEVAERVEVVAAGEDFAVSGEAIAAGAAGFLEEVFEGFGEIVVIDGADVGFIDAHAEGDGGDHDWALT